MKSHWVIDYETLSNCTILVAEHYLEKTRKEFVIHKLKNDFNDLLRFLLDSQHNKQYHISFNGLTFDSQISEYILKNSELLKELDGSQISNMIYQVSQKIIERQDNGEFPEYSEKNLSIPQIDVFKLNHWDNPAKRSSLKWIQYTMDWKNIQDMPIYHGKHITTLDEINLILSYCRNDVSSTKHIFYLSKKAIKLRKDLTVEYDIPLMSASEPKISKELFLHFLTKATGISKYDLRQMRTYRTQIVLKDIILPFVKFQSPEFQELLEVFKSIVIEDPNNIKGVFKTNITHKNVKTDFGLGGAHGATKSGIYKSDDNYTLITSDVVSFYPNLIIRNKWSPAHIPSRDFNELYEWFFTERRKISKKDVRNYIYKIILNSTYGLSNDANSFLYDPELTLKVTINGQLTLMMLYEMISLGIPGSIPLMQNTDGVENLIPNDSIDKYYEICKEWEKLTSLELEHDIYQSLILADVNNYIAVYKEKEVPVDIYNELIISNPYYVFRKSNDKCYYSATKCKGRFEFSELALHKNKSFLVVPKSIYNYFVHNILPEDTLFKNSNIFDFCAGFKTNSGWVLEKICYIKGAMRKEELQKVIRYYISNKGCKITKRNVQDGREVQIEADKRAMITVFNKYVEMKWSDYDINMGYYLDKIYKEIENIEFDSSQLKLF